jgi:hypothetical protein
VKLQYNLSTLMAPSAVEFVARVISIRSCPRRKGNATGYCASACAASWQQGTTQRWVRAPAAWMMMHGRKRCQIWPVFADARGSSEPAVGPHRRYLVPRSGGTAGVGVGRPAQQWVVGERRPAPPRCCADTADRPPVGPTHVARFWSRGAHHDRW